MFGTTYWRTRRPFVDPTTRPASTYGSLITDRTEPRMTRANAGA